MLKAMGIEDEKIDQIIAEHAESVNALRPSLITVRSTPTQSYDYQPIGAWWFDCQPDRHCAKTIVVPCKSGSTFDCQLDRHCSKTLALDGEGRQWFDYQLDRHCSKTQRG